MDYKAEIFDQIQLLYGVNRCNDHELHCVLRFETAPDAEILRKSVIASIEAIPILGARYVDGDKPHWTSLDPRDFERAFVVAPTEADFDAFVVSGVDEGLGPQVRVCLIDAGPFAVALKMNHMVCDAAGLKQYLDFLSNIYRGVSADSAFRPSVVDGDRGIGGVLKRFPVSVKFKSLLLQSGDNNRSGNHRFPLSEDAQARPFIVTRKLARNRVAALKDYCRAQAATLNDAVLTAFYRRLFQRLSLKPGDDLQIPVMVDMRRYLGETGEFKSPTNLTSMVNTRLDYRPTEHFEDTLARVKAVMDEKKASAIGINGFVKLDLLFRIFGDAIAYRRLKSGLKNPFICMTNIGILDPDRMSFGALRPIDAFLCGSIKHRPYFQLAMSSYNGELTFSVNQFGAAGDRERIVSLLEEIEAELPG